MAYHDCCTVDEGELALHIVLPDETSAYTVFTESEDAEEMELSVLTKERYLSVSSTAAVGALFDPAGKVSLIGNQGAYEITAADDNIADNQLNIYTLTGENEGNVSLVVTEEGIRAEGDDLKDVVVEGNEGEHSQSVTVEETESRVEFSGEEETLEVTTAPQTAREDISEGQVELSQRMFWFDGKSHIPEVTVKWKGNVLNSETDYYIVYPQNSVSAGKKTLIIRGTGDYTGTMEATYRIEKNKDNELINKETETDNGGDTNGGGTMLVVFIGLGAILLLIILVIIVCCTSDNKARGSSTMRSSLAEKPNVASEEYPDKKFPPGQTVWYGPRSGYSQMYGNSAKKSADQPKTEMMETENIPVKKSARLIRQKTKEIICIEKDDFRIGKKRGEVDYCIDGNATVSRCHARIICKGNTYYIMDMNSSNKTYVDGVMIRSEEEILLRDKTRIRLSDEEFVFELQ